MSNVAWNVGDVVVLKSGGPKMTISEVSAERPVVWCTWFEGAKRQTATFEAAILEKPSSDGPSIMVI